MINQDPNNNTFTQDHSPIIPQRSKLNYNLTIYERPDLTSKQKEFIELALDKKCKIILVNGPAGTSKTWLAVLCALKLLNQKRCSDILYIRSVVESSDSKIGALPGFIEDKFNVYLQPLVDKLEELLPKNNIASLQKEQRILGIPINFLRGLNWNAKAIVVDEAQNLNIKEMITLLTRIGKFSKVYILGDHCQSDLNGKSGFLKILNLFTDEISRENGIYTFQFSEDDVVRSELVKFIVKKIKELS
jgi:phosphate starvation-inducible PhoH-like protein